MAEGKLQSHPNLRDIRAMLDEHELFDELAADFADLLVGQLKELTDVALDGLIPGDELSLEPDPRRGAGWDGNPVERKRLKHVPALLAGALARRLEVDEDAVQTLWTAVGVRDESCTATFHHVVQQATSDPVLRPFAVMLVERWESSQAASS